MENQLMHLKILLPSQVFADKQGVMRVVVETHGGSFGLLPQRLDCAAALTAGILTYETAADGVVHVAVGEGVLLKTGREVYVSARAAVGGTDLGRLHEAVSRELRQVDEKERQVRTLVARLESGFVRRFLEFHHG